MDIVTVYKKTRKQFGRYCGHLDVSEPEVIIDIKPNEDVKKKYIKKEPFSTGVQAVPEFSEHYVNTLTHETKEQGMLHLEGGWPKDVDTSKLSSKERYIKKIETNMEDINSFIALRESVEHYLDQNSALDIYQDYFTDSVQDFHSEKPMAKTISVMKDPCVGSKRAVTRISWLPSDGSKIAVAYSNLDFQSFPVKTPTNAYVWDVNNPNEPEVTLLPNSPLVSIKYNPKESYTVAGGCYNGIVSVFDTRKGSEEVLISDLKYSHRDPVYEIHWLQSKSSTFFLTTSTDGQVLTWDTRSMKAPVEAFDLKIPDDKNEYKLQGILGGESLDYDIAYSPTKFMVGTEQGAVISCTRRKNKGTSIDKVYYGHHHHHGPIYSIQRSPFIQKYFMTIGDWTIKIWNEDISNDPIISTKYHDSYLTSCQWSPSRPGVFYTTKMDGTLDVWDYMYKQNKPLLSVRLSDQGLHCLSVYGKYLAVGGRDGATRLLEVSEGLRGEDKQAVLEEKDIIFNMLERESKRERVLIDNRKEAEQNLKRIEGKRKQREENLKNSFSMSINEDDVQEEEALFLDQIKKK
ncbi:hypothetical protein ABK040_015532 [Willaertia magna]